MAKNKPKFEPQTATVPVSPPSEPELVPEPEPQTAIAVTFADGVPDTIANRAIATAIAETNGARSIHVDAVKERDGNTVMNVQFGTFVGKVTIPKV